MKTQDLIGKTIVAAEFLKGEPERPNLVLTFSDDTQVSISPDYERDDMEYIRLFFVIKDIKPNPLELLKLAKAELESFLCSTLSDGGEICMKEHPVRELLKKIDRICMKEHPARELIKKIDRALDL